MAILVLATACEATVPGLGVNEEEPDAILRGQFNRDVLPLMTAKCLQCHGGSMTGLNFVGSPDDTYTTVYDRVKDWPALVNLNEPLTSRLVTKGIHDGPEWSATEKGLIEPWLINEANFGRTGNEVETNAVPLIGGANSIDLGDIGLPDMAGTIIKFDFAISGDLLLFTAIRADAPATGAVLDNMVISVRIGAVTRADPLNTFSAVKTDMAPSSLDNPIGGGVLIRSDVGDLLVAGAGTPQVLFNFKEAIPVGTGTNNSDPLACKTIGQGGEFEAFMAAFAPPAGNANVCNGGNCHSAGNQAAGLTVAGFDSTDPAVIAQFCKNIRGKINITNPAGIHIIIEKANGRPSHVGGAPGSPWQNTVQPWAAAELAAGDAP